jgi:uncharacterized protein Yka (UPF0111/DUF47 family)
MFSLQKLLGKDDQFYSLLEASAEEGRTSALALLQVLKNSSTEVSMAPFVGARRKDKEITAEITSLLCRTFVTTLEREDIEALSKSLYKIPKTIEKIVERYLIIAPQIKDVDLRGQTNLLVEATETVVTMVKGLRHTSDLIKLTEHNTKLQQIEGAADKLMLELLRELYAGKYDPIKAVALKDLYELLEKVVDRCRDAGNVISHIILKYS